MEAEQKSEPLNSVIICNFSFLISIVKVIWGCVLQTFKKLCPMINGSYDKDSDATKLYNALSTLSDHVTTMDTALMSFYLSISKIIETAKDNFIAARLGKPHSADIQIESLIQIIQKSQILFRKIQGEISQNESVSVDLVLKCNPHFLIDQ